MRIVAIRNQNLDPAADNVVTVAIDRTAQTIAVGLYVPAGAQTPDLTNAGKPYVLAAATTVAFSDLKALRGFADKQTFVLAVAQGQRFAPVFALFVETMPTRLAPIDYARRLGLNFIALLHVPFADAGFDDIAVSVNLPPTNGALVLSGDITTFEQSTLPTGFAFGEQFFPRVTLSGPANIAAGQPGTVTAQLTDAGGNPLARAGVTLFFDTVCGQLSHSRKTTDANGQCTIAVLTPGMAAGDTIRVKAGFKFFPAVTDLTIPVV